jgi:hypothetical protein
MKSIEGLLEYLQEVSDEYWAQSEEAEDKLIMEFRMQSLWYKNSVDHVNEYLSIND